MKKANVLSTLVIITALCGWIATLPRPLAAQGQAQQASPWKDRAEYDAYNAAVQAKDPNQQIELADKYLAAYPQSKVAESVYTLKLQAYQKITPPNVQKIEETAGKLLEMNPKQLYALIVLTSLFPQTFNPQDPAAEQKLNTAGDYAKRGLEAIATLPKPAGISDDDFKKQKDPLEAGFHFTAGFVALKKKDFEQAQQELHKSVEMNPSNAAGFYNLGLAYVTAKPPQYEQGIWALARAVSTTGPTALPPEAQKQVKEYLDKVYEARHGSTEGLDDVLKQSASSAFPPQDFHIKTAEEVKPSEPEPAPQKAAEAKRELSVKPEELSDFGVIQKYLSGGGQKAEDTWTLLKGATLPLPGKVVSATPPARPKTILLAVAPELATQDGKYDVEVTLATPLSKPVAKGDTIQCEGTADSFRAKPFLLRLTDGKVTK